MDPAPLLRHRALQLFSLFPRSLAGLLACCCWAGLPPDGQAQTARPGMGAIVYADAGGTGVAFRVWAPNATSVGVKGEFNGWAVIPMVAEGTTGNWSVEVPGAQPGQQYLYRINNSFDRRDPRARRVTNSGDSGNSIIYDPNAFQWAPNPIPMPFRNELVIYQMHVGTFGGQNPPSTFDQAIDRLDHVRDLGINVIKLMPVNEFPGGRSWGYNPTDLFSIESDYGGPDAFKRFVEACHQRGLAVFIDVVHNHYGPSDLGRSMWEFDGGAWGPGGIYFYNDWRAETPWGATRPHFGRQPVRDFIRDQIFMFVQEYRAGGFRWDSVYNIINYGTLGPTTNPDGWTLLRDINWDLSQQYPHVVRGAEDHHNDHPMNFENQWDVRYWEDLSAQITIVNDGDRNMGVIQSLLTAWPGHHRVVFSEAHDYIAAIREGRSRIPEMIDWLNPESIYARKRSLLAAGIVMTTPGIPMIFQGQEMLETLGFHDDTPLRWDRTESFAGIVRAYTDMIHTRRNLRGGMEGLKGVGVQVNFLSHSDKVISYVRWNQGNATDDVLVVANFRATPWTGYSIPFPSSGEWYSHFNSDAQVYGADFGNVGTPQVTVSGGQGLIDMGAYSIQIFSKTAPPPPTGQATVSPNPAEACAPVTIVYNATGGPLHDAANVVLFIGRNGWQQVQEISMTATSANQWTATLPATPAATQFNLVFHNGAAVNRIWDNNNGQDWNVPVSPCEHPIIQWVGATRHTPPNGALSPADAILIDVESFPEGAAIGGEVVYTIDGWTTVGTAPLTFTGSGAGTFGQNDGWSATLSAYPACTVIEYAVVLQDGNGLDYWDNNNGPNYAAAVECGPLEILDPAAAITVAHGVTTYTLHGLANDLQGNIRWTNALTGGSGSIPFVPAWTFADVPLGVGANVITVQGDYLDDTEQQLAADSGAAPAYDSGWATGSNGGAGFGPWAFYRDTENPDQAGWFLSGDPLLGVRPWGLYANSGKLAEAKRPFTTPLQVGGRFFVKLRNGHVDTGSGVGVALQNSAGDTLWQFWFDGGEANYKITGGTTDIGWTSAGLEIQFTLTGANTFSAEILPVGGTPRTYTGTLSAHADMNIGMFRVWNYSAGFGSQGADLLVNDLEILAPGAGQLETVSTSIIITREPDDNPDSNGDGVPDAWYILYGYNPGIPNLAAQKGLNNHTLGASFRLGLNPNDPTSVFAIDRIRWLVGGQLDMRWAAMDGRRYVVQFTPTLNPPAWVDLPGGPVDLPGDGTMRLAPESALGPPTGGLGYYRVQFIERLD